MRKHSTEPAQSRDIPFEQKRIIVTGGAGFLGSHLLEKLHRRGCSNIFVPQIGDYDLRHRPDTERLFRDFPADMVIHLAAVVGGIGANRAKPGSFFYDNAIMGIDLIEQARRVGVGKLILLGTICAYPKYSPVPFREEDLWNGYPEETNAPYGLAKKMLLVQAQAYRQQYGMNAIYLLPVNLYGPRDNFDLETGHVIPALIRKFVEGKKDRAPFVTVWGSGKISREFLYVEDAADGIILAAEKYDKPEPVNLGSGEEIQIADLVQMIKGMVGFEGEVVWDAGKPDGQPRRRLDVERAWREFGFKARTSLETGLAKTIEWYLNTFAPAPRGDVG